MYMLRYTSCHVKWHVIYMLCYMLCMHLYVRMFQRIQMLRCNLLNILVHAYVSMYNAHACTMHIRMHVHISGRISRTRNVNIHYSYVSTSLSYVCIYVIRS